MSYELILGDALGVLPGLAAGSVDAVLTDPPYAEIDRAYGRLTEAQWWELMMGVCTQVRRVLKPTGSAVFIIQPNSRKLGIMRGWVFEFMAWVCREWNMIQDAYWWNIATMPTVHNTKFGLLRGSIKPVVWAGSPDCYRNQEAVLWKESDEMTAQRLSGRLDNGKFPSGHSVDRSRVLSASERRGGVTPFNVLPMANTQGRCGHGAGTPLPLASWWTRYICPPGGVLLDPFSGAGTMGLAAIAHGAHYIGIERMPEYHGMAQARLGASPAPPPIIPHADLSPPTVQAELIAHA